MLIRAICLVIVYYFGSSSGGRYSSSLDMFQNVQSQLKNEILLLVFLKTTRSVVELIILQKHFVKSCGTGKTDKTNTFTNTFEYHTVPQSSDRLYVHTQMQLHLCRFKCHHEYASVG